MKERAAGADPGIEVSRLSLTVPSAKLGARISLRIRSHDCALAPAHQVAPRTFGRWQLKPGGANAHA